MNDVDTFDKLLKIKPESCNNDKDLLEAYKQTLIFNKVSFSNFISDFNQSLKENPDEVSKNLSMLNDTDYTTPKPLIKEMFDKFSETPSSIIDPCCGRGAMLIYAHQTYGIPKELCIGIDIDKRNAAYLNKAGYMNVIRGDATDDKTWNRVNIIKMELEKNGTRKKIFL